MTDDTDLDRFVRAQDPVWDDVRRELSSGRKTSHWMWFVFPQLRGLGRSETARFFGITDRDEAEAYARHPVLGSRLDEATRLLLNHADTPIQDILGDTDALKLRSSATLFERTAPAPGPFTRVLDSFYDGERCPHTEERLG
ncbi:DUF1810 domain-containing protein [Tranquillimonas rosea]|uniref:DUF1810 domain-containing protein n=1 Tax=Tranquillimonas rosea TaxID=641238 RepID=UPI003BA99976